MASGATIHGIKALSDQGSGSYSAIIAAMRWVLNDCKQNGWNGVISLSLGGSRSKSLDDAVKEVVNTGIPVAVAAGNDYGGDACSVSPAGDPSAVTVGSTTSSDARSSFSNVGVCVDIFAPGEWTNKHLHVLLWIASSDVNILSTPSVPHLSISHIHIVS